METNNNMGDSISHSVTVDIPQERAFYAFAQQQTSWWPREYTWSEELGHVVLEPEIGSRWYEVDKQGSEKPDWGRLLAWEPPGRLVLSWMIGARRQAEIDTGNASEIEVIFRENTPGKTTVTVNHRGFEHHGEGWQGYRDGMSSAEGWPKILQSYSDYVREQIKFGAVA